MKFRWQSAFNCEYLGIGLWRFQLFKNYFELNGIGQKNSKKILNKRV